jgi:hypothetical protein
VRCDGGLSLSLSLSLSPEVPVARALVVREALHVVLRELQQRLQREIRAQPDHSDISISNSH